MITFQLTPDQGDSFEVTATTRDVLVWERTTKGASFGQFMNAESMRLGDMYKIAYLACKRQGLAEGTQADFETSHDLDFEMDEEPDPTLPTP